MKQWTCDGRCVCFSAIGVGLALGAVESGKRSRWELGRALVILVNHQSVVGAVNHTVLEKDHPKTCLVRR